MRLDILLVEKGFAESRTKAKQYIERGEIFIDGKKADKPALEISGVSVKIERVCSESFVSLGGYKLSKAIKDFSYSVKDKIAADIGASTGGFTDCLIKNGAKKVYAVDLNDGLLHADLKNNVKVIPIIKNAKELVKGDFAENLDLVVSDLSFISETLILPVIYSIIKDGAEVIALIKPQFENDVKIKFKNGIIKDEKIIVSACKKVYDCAVRCGFMPENVTCAPVFGKRNTEFLLLLSKRKGCPLSFEEFFEKISIYKN